MKIEIFLHNGETDELTEIGHKLEQLLKGQEKVMSTIAEEVALLNSFADRLTALKTAIDALKAAIANQGNTSPEVDAALTNVESALKADEDDANP